MRAINILKLILTFILKCMCLNMSSTDEEFVLDSLSSQCPYMSTCSQPAQQEFTYSLSKYTPCCQECSCSPQCHVEGNCCPDVSHNSTDIPDSLSQVAETLSRSQCIQSRYPGYPNANGYNSYIYKVVTTCPEEYPNNVIAQKCASEEPTRIEQVLLVSDGKDTIYRNIYCAQCNEAQRVTRWTAMVRCLVLKHPEVSFQVELSHILDRNCELISVPKGSLRRIENKRCFVPDVSECNMTGIWDVYDEDTERSCETVTSAYLSPVMRVVYKNIFCYMCNGIRPYKEYICPAPTYHVKGAFGQPFTAILDLHALSSFPERMPQRCGRQEIYDPVFMRCRELICTPESSPVNGECVRIFVTTDGFTMKFYFKVEPVDKLTTIPTEREGEHILNRIYNYLTKKLNRNCRMCTYVGRQVPMQLANYTLVIELKIVSSFSCPLSVLLNSMEDVSTFIYNANSTGNFSVERIENAYIHQYPNILKVRVLFKKLNGECIHVYDIAFSRFISCPRVVISGLDFKTLLRNNSISNLALYDNYNIAAFTENELANKTFELCVADYIYVANTGRSNKTTFNRYPVCILVYLTFLWCAIGLT